MNVVLIVGLRLENPGWVVPDTDGYRKMNWEYSRSRWERLLPDVPIFEGHDEGAHTFCLARAQNEAARLAGNWDLAVYVGADFVAETEEMVRTGIQQAKKKRQFTITHGSTTMLGEESSELVRAGSEPDPKMGVTYDNPFTGIAIIPRTLFDEVGGFDERFVGWGWEDQSFWAACWAYGGGFQRTPGRAYHLWHPRTRADNEENPHHAAGEVLGRRYIAARGSKQRMSQILAEKS